MSRLLFAAARGARLQTAILAWGTDKHIGWDDDIDIPVGVLGRADPTFIRIHPDDKHLQYGPISTVLREDAGDIQVKRKDIVCDTLGGVAPYAVEPNWRSNCNDELHRSLFLLILAEALADEGL